MTDKPRDPRLQAILDEKLPPGHEPEAAPTAPAAAAPPTREEILKADTDPGYLSTFGNAVGNKFVLGQMDAFDKERAATLASGRKHNPLTAGAGDIAGSLARAIPLMPFAGPIAPVVGMNTLERAIDVERGKIGPGEALTGTALDAAGAGAGAGAVRLGARAFAPSGARALRMQPTGTSVPEANTALHAAEAVPKVNPLAEGFKTAQSSLPFAAGSAGGGVASMAGASPGAIATVGSIASSLPSLFSVAKALVSNTGRDSARRAIDLLAGNPTRAANLIGAGPALGTTAAEGAGAAVGGEADRLTPWGRRRKPQ